MLQCWNATIIMRECMNAGMHEWMFLYIQKGIFNLICSSFFTHPISIGLSIRDVLRSCVAPVTPATSCLFSLSVRTQFRCFVPILLRAVVRYKETFFLASQSFPACGRLVQMIRSSPLLRGVGGVSWYYFEIPCSIFDIRYSECILLYLETKTEPNDSFFP